MKYAELIQPIHPDMPTELNASAIPTDFKCKTLHSKSIHLSWYLPSSGRYGNVVGYMALYAPSDQWIGNTIPVCLLSSSLLKLW